jgi:hypothetical protein
LQMLYSAQMLAAPVAQDSEQQRRVQYAGEHFGAETARGRMYLRYGPPDTIDDHGSSQIWRYTYLESFGGGAEFEFPQGNSVSGMRINWPPPSTTFEGVPEKARKLDFPDGPHRFKRTPRRTPFAQHSYCTLTVSLEGFSGALTVYGMIGTANNQTVAVVMDRAESLAGTWQARFMLAPGTYVAHL